MKTEVEKISICKCGHTGDGFDTDHNTIFQGGHGACTKCDCRQFTWKEWVK